jgi:hypothetical protein
MITRKSLTVLAAITVVLFAIAATIGTNHHGAVNVISRIAWFGFLVCALFLVLASIATIIRHRARHRAS